MLLEEYTAKDSENKNRVYLKLMCDQCKTEYTRQKRFASNVHGCSPKCLAKLRGESVDVTCAHCAKPFEVKKSRLDRSKSEMMFCSRTCHNLGVAYIEEIKPSHYGTSNKYRPKALREYGAVCNRCGFNDIRALEVHHIDRNRDNNDINNLEVLCANCHSIEHKT